MNTIAETISTRLNTIWDPAWNVVILRQAAGYDSVVYGYAFRDHWMWINGVAVPETLSYIIWKDFNC